MNVDQKLLMLVLRAANEAGIDPRVWSEFLGTIRSKLGTHNVEHYEHSLRVGWYAYNLAGWERQVDLHAPLFAGVGHDVGKCDIANEILRAETFGEEEMAAVRAHTVHGYEHLHEKFLFTALVAGRHHKFQPNGYGIEYDEIFEQPSPELCAAADSMARFIMICDFFDAITTRGEKFPGNPRQVMDEFFGDQPSRVAWLFVNQYTP